MWTEYLAITEDKPFICAQGTLCSGLRWHLDNLGKDDARVYAAHSLAFIFSTSPIRRSEQWRHAPLIEKPGGPQIGVNLSPPSITAHRKHCRTGMRCHPFSRGY